MTQTEKNRKLGIIRALLLVKQVQIIKDPPMTIQDAIIRAMDVVFWAREQHLVAKQHVFEQGGTEIIAKRNLTVCDPDFRGKWWHSK